MGLLTIEQLKQRVSELTYRPGWTMEVTEGTFEGPHFHVFAEEPDTTQPGKTIPLDIHSRIPPQISMESFDLWIANRLIIIEIHESREWLRLKSNGKALFYPHINQSDQDKYDIEAFQEYREETRKLETYL